jgi:hypothetical protein
MLLSEAEPNVLCAYWWRVLVVRLPFFVAGDASMRRAVVVYYKEVGCISVVVFEYECDSRPIGLL